MAKTYDVIVLGLGAMGASAAYQLALRGAAGSAEIAPRVLSRELKALVGSGLIARKDYGTVPPKVDYRLTPKGRSFVPVIDSIRRWGHRHLVAS